MTEEKKDIQPKKRTGRAIVARVFGVLLVAFLAGFLALQSPAVQSWLARKAVSRLVGRIDGDISFESVQFRPFHGFTVKNLVIRDRHPYRSSVPGMAPASDTLARVGSMSATFNLMQLLQDDFLTIRTASIRDVDVCLSLAPDDSLGQLNVVRIFGLDEEDSESGDLNLFTCRTLYVKDVHVRYIDYPVLEARLRDSLAAPVGTDFADLDVRLDLSAHNVSLLNNSFAADIASLRACEKGGLAVEPFSGSLRIGTEGASLTDAVLADRSTKLAIRRLSLDYPGGMEDFDGFVHKVPLTLDLDESTLDIRSAVPVFAGLEGRQFSCRVKGQAEGTLDALRIPMLRLLDTDNGLSGLVTGRIYNLPDMDRLRFELSLDNFRASASDIDRTIDGLLPGQDPKLREIYKGGRLTASVRATGAPDDFKMKGAVRDAQGGRMTLDGTVRNLVADSPVVLDGNLATSNLNLGRILDVPSLGEVSLTSRLTAELKNSGPEAKIYSLEVGKLSFYGYDYGSIYATGILGRNSYKGSIVSRDPNLDFLFGGQIILPTATENGKYAFTADVGFADLSALHLDSRETAQMDFRLIADYIETPDGDFRGDIHIRNLNLMSDTGMHHAGNITVSSSSSENDHRIDLTSRFAAGTFEGSQSVTRFVTDFLDATLRKELPTYFGEVSDTPDEERGNYRVDFLLGDTREIIPFFLPGMYVAENTRLALELNEEGRLDGQLSSDGLIHEGLFAKFLDIDFDNAGGYLAASGFAEEAGFRQDVTFLNNTFSAYASGDAIDLRYRNDISGTEPGDRADLHMRAFISRDEELGDPVLTADIPSSRIVYMGTPWDITSGRIRYRSQDTDLEVDDFQLASGKQSLRAEGRLSPYDDGVMNLQIQDFDVSLINRISDLRLDLKGVLSGRAQLVSPFDDIPNLVARLYCENTVVGGYEAGTLGFDSEWEEEAERFRVRLRDSKRSMLGTGFIYPNTQDVDATFVFDRFQIGYVAPILANVFSDFEGHLSGQLDVTGKLSNPQLDGTDLSLSDGLLQVDYTDVPYLVDGPLLVSGQKMRFDSLKIRDRYEGTATARGGIHFDHFRSLSYDIDFDVKDMEALDLGKKQNEQFYGNVFATGRVSINGDLALCSLDIDGQTVRRGNLHIPFDYMTDASTGDLLRFLEPEKPVKVNPLDSILTRRRSLRGTPTETDLDLRVTASPETQILIELDPSTGNVLTARGEGTLELGYHRHDFTMNGDYVVTSGNYHFSAIVASRDFEIENGSKIHFNGDIYDSDLDMKATYATRASLAPLIADSTSTRVPVNCKVAITDKLRNPTVDLSIEVPQLDPTTQGLVSGALNNQDNIQRQFLSLLVSGNFLPSEQSGVLNSNSNMLFSNVSAIMSDQLNNILANLGIPLDLGLSYQSTEAGNDIFDVAISTQLFNDRVIVNGSVGNRQYSSSGTNTSEVAGDLDIAVKLNKSGSVRATFFSHSTDQYTNYLDTSQRNGAGFSYQKEFSTFGALIQDIIHGQGWNSSNQKVRTEGEQVTITIDPPQNDHGNESR